MDILGPVYGLQIPARRKRLRPMRRRQSVRVPRRESPGGFETLAIVVPVFNDWECAAQILPMLDHALAGAAPTIHVVLVDDGSSTPPPPQLVRDLLPNIAAVHLVTLRRNLGHQRAIAIGLYYVYRSLSADAAVVMDGDGEDRPQDIPTLLEAFHKSGGREVVFAARTKRLERAAFRFFYRMYRLVHRVLTGIPVRVGNFSVIPQAALSRLMVSSDLWNHYAAGAFRSKLAVRSVPLPRGARLDGHSHMNFFGLVVHGLSAISVFADVVSVRLLVGAVALLLLSVMGIGGMAYAHTTGLAVIPGWAIACAALVALTCVQAVMLALALVLPIVSGRSNTSFIPLRDAEYFILADRRVWPPT